MSKYYFIFFSLWTTILFGQNNNSDTTVYWVVDHNAQFPGGTIALKKFVKDKLWQPKTVKCEYKKDGTIYINFIVEKDGTIRNARVLKSTFPCDECKIKAIDIVTSMPKWKPAVLDHITVRSFFNLPINFSDIE